MFHVKLRSSNLLLSCQMIWITCAMVGTQVIFWRYTAPICYGIWSRIWFIMLDGTFKYVCLTFWFSFICSVGCILSIPSFYVVLKKLKHEVLLDQCCLHLAKWSISETKIGTQCSQKNLLLFYRKKNNKNNNKTFSSVGQRTLQI